jgi:stage III sporulation protein AH
MTRQKIWFLSMFTLMVALSAYYLLSEDMNRQLDAPPVNESAVSDEATNGDQTDVEMSEVSEVTDEEVLEQLQSGEVTDFFAETHMKERDELALQTEKYMKIITDPESTTQAISTAMAAMQQLENQSETITELQEKLQQHFPDAVVKQEDAQWRVIVQSDALKREQVVQILQMATEHLKIRPEQVSVQYRE